MRVGPVGEGWRVGTTTLMNERVSIGGNALVPQGSGPIAEPLELWARSPRKDPTKRTELAQLWIEAEILRLLAYQAQARRQRGVPGPEGSLLKLGNALLRQRIGVFVVGLLGAAGTLCDYDATPRGIAVGSGHRFPRQQVQIVGRRHFRDYAQHAR